MLKLFEPDIIDILVLFDSAENIFEGWCFYEDDFYKDMLSPFYDYSPICQSDPVL